MGSTTAGTGGVLLRGSSPVAGTMPPLDPLGTHGHTFSGTAVTDHTHTVTINNNTGGGNAHNNVQPTMVLNYIIKT